MHDPVELDLYLLKASPFVYDGDESAFFRNSEVDPGLVELCVNVEESTVAVPKADQCGTVIRQGLERHQCGRVVLLSEAEVSIRRSVCALGPVLHFLTVLLPVPASIGPEVEKVFDDP